MVNKLLNKLQLSIIKVIRNNSNITIAELSLETGLGHTAIQNNLNKMQDLSVIKRMGSRKTGYWKVIK